MVRQIYKTYVPNPTQEPNQVSADDFLIALDNLEESNLLKQVTSPEGNVFLKEVFYGTNLKF